MRENVRVTARWAVLLLLTMSSFLAQAQERRVTGKVTTSTDGQGLPGVNVQVQGTNVGTVTDAEGQFTIAVPGANSVLVISSKRVALLVDASDMFCNNRCL